MVILTQRKWIYVIFILIYFFFGSIAFAGKLTYKLQSALESLTKGYLGKKNFKQGLSILSINSKSSEAKNKGLGNTIREMIVRIIARSQKFYIIDRSSLDDTLKEIQLGQSGLLNEKNLIEAGKLIGVKFFLKGTISEIHNDFVINLNLIEAETGRLISSESVSVTKRKLIFKKNQIDFGYIAKYGLGVNFQSSYVLHSSPIASNIFIQDVFMNYRPKLAINIKLGISSFNMLFPGFGSTGVSTNKVFPEVDTTTATNASDYQEATGSGVSYNGGSMNFISPYFGVDYNYTPNSTFTVALGFSIIVGAPEANQQYNPGLIYNSTTNKIEDFVIMPVSQLMQPLSILRLEVKPQYFISPRFTVGLYIAYLVATPLTINKTRINDDYRVFPHHEEPRPEDLTKYLGLKANILADGHNIEDISIMNSMALGLSLNFYF